MSEYGFAHSQRVVLSPSTVAQRKEARRRLLEEVERRRAETMRRWRRKMRLQKASELDTIA